MDSTAKRVDASVRLQIPLSKFRNEEAMIELTVSEHVESVVAISCSVAGFMTDILCEAETW